jgi:hypothetical protein
MLTYEQAEKLLQEASGKQKKVLGIEGFSDEETCVGVEIPQEDSLSHYLSLLESLRERGSRLFEITIEE